LENEKQAVPEESQQKKPAEKKKEGRIAKVYRLHQKGVSAKEIAAKTKLSERIVRSYIWRMKNPEKYRELLKRYFAKKKAAQQPGA
jgi:DNA-binding NarL/FixJ family response regulator